MMQPLELSSTCLQQTPWCICNDGHVPSVLLSVNMPLTVSMRAQLSAITRPSIRCTRWCCSLGKTKFAEFAPHSMACVQPSVSKHVSDTSRGMCTQLATSWFVTLHSSLIPKHQHALEYFTDEPHSSLHFCRRLQPVHIETRVIFLL